MGELNSFKFNNSRIRNQILIIRIIKAKINESSEVAKVDQPIREVPIPYILPAINTPKYGFVENAERINGRFAMIAFLIILLIEAITKRGLLELAGIQTGNGIDIGF